MVRVIILFVLMGFTFIPKVQGDQMRRVLRLLERSDIERAVEALQEGLTEDRDHAGYLWIAAKLVSTDTLSYYNLDSAYVLVKEALVAYDSAQEEQLKDFEKLPFVRGMIEETDVQILGMFWERTQINLSQEALKNFIALYPEAVEVKTAEFQIDSIGYEMAIAVGSWQAYLDYQRNYPESPFKAEAEERYQRLLYRDKTNPETEEALESFLKTYMDSPFREDAIGRLIKYKLFWNHADTLLVFAAQYKGSRHVQKALEYAYHLNQEVRTDQIFTSQYQSLDSLDRQHRLAQEAVFLLPTNNGIKTVSFGDQSTGMIGLQSVQGEFVHCGPYKEDFFFGTKNGTASISQRSGQTILEGDYDEVEEVGLGALLVKDGNGKGFLFHKTGDKILENVDQARVFADRWIKVQRNGLWALASLNGELLTSFQYQEIEEVGSYWMFSKDDLFAFTSPESIKEEIGTGGFTLLFKYDDYEIVDEDWMIGFKGENEGLINQELEFIIPWGNHEIYPNKRVPFTKRSGRYTIYPQELDMSQLTYDQVLVNEDWIAVKDSVWWYRKTSKYSELKDVDSARLIGDHHLLTVDSSSFQLHFVNDSILQFSAETQIRLLDYGVGSKGKEESYLLISDREVQQLYDAEAALLFEVDRNRDIKSIGDSLFAVSAERGKSGVMQREGEWLLQPRYNFINREGGIINLVLGNEIGGYVLSDSTYFDTEYIANIVPFGNYYMTSKATGKGIMDKEETEVMPFRYKDLDFYSDSLIWVKTDSSWQVEHMLNEQVIQYGVREYEKLHTPGGDVFRVTTSSGYGLLDIEGNYIIQPSFSDIRLIASDDGYFYLCEKSVPEAGFYIWVGFDASGKKFFSEAYREEDYDKIACD